MPLRHLVGAALKQLVDNLRLMHGIVKGTVALDIARLAKEKIPGFLNGRPLRLAAAPCGGKIDHRCGSQHRAGQGSEAE